MTPDTKRNSIKLINDNILITIKFHTIVLKTNFNFINITKHLLKNVIYLSEFIQEDALKLDPAKA